MNARLFRAGPSSNPIVQVLSFIVAGLVLIGAVLMGAVILAFVLGFAVLFGIVFWLRIQWLAHKMRRAGSASKQQRGGTDGKVIEVEYTVVEERKRRD